MQPLPVLSAYACVASAVPAGKCRVRARRQVAIAAENHLFGCSVTRSPTCTHIPFACLTRRPTAPCRDSTLPGMVEGCLKVPSVNDHINLRHCTGLDRIQQRSRVQRLDRLEVPGIVVSWFLLVTTNCVISLSRASRPPFRRRWKFIGRFIPWRRELPQATKRPLRSSTSLKKDRSVHVTGAPGRTRPFR